MQKIQREEWIDLAKVITMVLVVVGHASYYNINSYFGGIHYEGTEVHHSLMSQFINTIVNFIYQFHMPFFMAISGMTYAISYKSNKKISTIAKSKAIRLLIPMFLVTIFMSIPLKFVSGYWDDSSYKIVDIFFGQVLLFGNTHLWFLASLFLITIIFTYLYRKNLIFFKSIPFWCLLVIISYIGIFLSSRGAYLGIPGALKNFIFFTSGFCFYDIIRQYQSNLNHVIAGWSSMIVVYALSLIIATHIPRFQNIIYVPMAFLGCYNMVATTKYILKKSSITKSTVYRNFSKNSYDIYLYSDPFNYVLILCLFLLFNNDIFENPLVSALSFLSRIILTIIWAYIVIFFVNVVAKRKSLK